MPQTTTSELLSLGELRSALVDRGVRLSDRQFKRLRAEGLLACEGQSHHQGLRGSASMYSRRAIEQLELVSVLARTERRFAQRRILVRWHGGWVDPDLLRASFVEILDRASAAARRLSAGAGDAGDRADRLVQAIGRSAGTGAATGLMRKRLGSATGDMERVVYALAAMSMGAPLEWENHDPNDPTEPLVDVFDRASGFDRARRDSIAGQPPILGQDESTQEILAELQAAGVFDLLDPAQAFRRAAHAEIEQAFADAHSLEALQLAVEAMEAVAGEDAAGLGSLTAIVPDQADAWSVTMLIRSCLLLRRIVPPGALENIVQAAEEHRAVFEVGLAIRRALPQYAQFIGFDGAEWLAALTPVERARVTGEIRSYIQADPHLSQLMPGQTT